MKKLFIVLVACLSLGSFALADGMDGWLMYNGSACTGDDFVGFTSSYSVLLILWSHGAFTNYRERTGGQVFQCMSGVPDGEYYETQ